MANDIKAPSEMIETLLWNKKFDNIKKYIDLHESLPIEKCLRNWIDIQMFRYSKNIMDVVSKNKWESFINKYDKYFCNGFRNWNDMLKNVESYIIEIMNYIFTDHVSTVRIADVKGMIKWILRQDMLYKRRIGIMKYGNIRKTWKIFVHKYHLSL